MPYQLFLPKSDSKVLQNQSSATRNYLMDIIYNADTGIENIRKHPPRTKLDKIWDRWIFYMHIIELKDDSLLDNIEEVNIPSPIVYFADAVGLRDFSIKGEKYLIQGTQKSPYTKWVLF